MRFNQGLCHLALAESVAAESAASALAAARQAQRCFLEAMRMDRGMERAGRRLDTTAAMIAEYEEQVRREEEQDQEMQQAGERPDRAAEKLRDAESDLRAEVHGGGSEGRRAGRRRSGGIRRLPLEVPPGM